MIKSAILAVVILLPFPVRAQISQAPYERVLVPVYIAGEVAGAFGSVFTSELYVRNDGDETVRISQSPDGICEGICGGDGVPARSTQKLFLSVREGRPTFLYVGAPGEDKIAFNLRVQDRSRQALTWGTQIPVVRRRDWFTDRPIQLLNVPTDSRFRQTLRVYDYEGIPNRQIAIRFFDMARNILLAQRTYTTVIDEPNPFSAPHRPAYIQVDSAVAAVPEIANASLVRIEISAPFSIWGFASITNNETQHITTIAPN